MESIYFVLSWLCHRQCPHCYEDRFRPYHGAELERVVGEARANALRIVSNLPSRMTYSDGRERPGRIVLAGGEVLVDAIREPVLYPVMEALRTKYRSAGGVRVVVQTTGDLLTPPIAEELLDHGAWMISVSGLDDFHAGFEGGEKEALGGRLAAMLEAAGCHRQGIRAEGANPDDDPGPVYNMFGATPDAWIGKLWPRGRAWKNGLTSATLEDNFCNAWSGGLKFLRHGEAGSEVSVEPNGNVYPCCMKTKVPIGNLLEENLIDILDSLTGHPAFEAISAGHPERMGLSSGWGIDQFRDRSASVLPNGRPVANLCIGCDRFHEEVLAPEIAKIRAARLNRRAAAR